MVLFFRGRWVNFLLFCLVLWWLVIFVLMMVWLKVLSLLMGGCFWCNIIWKLLLVCMMLSICLISLWS